MERLTIRNTDGSVSQPTHSTFEKVFNNLRCFNQAALQRSVDYLTDMSVLNSGIIIIRNKGEV